MPLLPHPASAAACFSPGSTLQEADRPRPHGPKHGGRWAGPGWVRARPADTFMLGNSGAAAVCLRGRPAGSCGALAAPCGCCTLEANRQNPVPFCCLPGIGNIYRAEVLFKVSHRNTGHVTCHCSCDHTDRSWDCSAPASGGLPAAPLRAMQPAAAAWADELASTHARLSSQRPHSGHGQPTHPPRAVPCCTTQAGVHPEQPAHTLSREAFDTVWAHSVALLQRGFATGSILTVRSSRLWGLALRAGLQSRGAVPWAGAARRLHLSNACALRGPREPCAVHIWQGRGSV
jgi:hypothetical protein